MMSSSYHPQTDGQTERLNQCLEGFLRYSVHSAPKKWATWLPLAEFGYNYHSALGKTPFEVLYGHPPRHFGIVDCHTCESPDLAEWFANRDKMTQILQQLVRSRQRMKAQADKNRSERHFEVGDHVYLKLQPYVQSSLALRSNQKLSFQFFGPYTVLRRVGEVAYQLDLPPMSHIHDVVHVSQLKKYIPPKTQVYTDLSLIRTADCPTLVPTLVKKGSAAVVHVLVQ